MPTPTHQDRLSSLRAQLHAQKLDGFIVPICDEHMSEYVGAYAKRLEWLTGFNGSAGTAVVLADRAAIFVDGRYTLQVRDQVDGALWDYESVPETSVASWLQAHAPEHARIGHDPWLHSRSWVKNVAKKLAKTGGDMVPVDTNPIDAIWADQPQPSAAPASPHPDTLAGRSSADKRAEITAWLGEQGLDSVVITALDSIAWLLNIRGKDVERTPVAQSFLIQHRDGTAQFFIAPEKTTPALIAHLGGQLEIRPYTDFATALGEMADQRVAFDPQLSVAAIPALLEQGGAIAVEATDPCQLLKATKNTVEQAGHRAAQRRDGAAMVRFLCWLAENGQSGTISEMAAAEQLHQYRQDTGKLHDLSFDTISGAGPNGAIVHYRVSESTNRLLDANSVYLVDSGGQYADGTTDITRTIWIGPDAAPANIKEHFTRVLQGHITLARAQFPTGTAGSQLDVLARMALWQAGLDYAHGTGHGVGSFLSVHEGPQRISKTPSTQELLPGMIISNEPGYYKAGAYGIRIENLVLVEERQIKGAEGSWLGFETLTLVPIDRNLLMPDMLDETQRTWWNAYHAHVAEIIGPLLPAKEQAWLAQACAPLPASDASL